MNGPATDPKVAQIKHLIDVMVAAGAVEVELEEAGTKIRVRLKEDRPLAGGQLVGGQLVGGQLVGAVAQGGQAASAPAHTHPGAGGVNPSHVPGAAGGRADEAFEGEIFKSPMVGTFYSAPSPEAEPFVKIGEKVKADQTICIIEAMKVMNEIKAERVVTVIKILAQNGEPVEFGQPLFLVKS
jgi:acetyl-CoA carboxylase biotin carboxyl carrier protein